MSYWPGQPPARRHNIEAILRLNILKGDIIVVLKMTLRLNDVVLIPFVRMIAEEEGRQVRDQELVIHTRFSRERPLLLSRYQYYLLSIHQADLCLGAHCSFHFFL